MERSLVLLVGLLATVLAEQDVFSPRARQIPEGRVINGVAADPGEFPSFVTIFLDDYFWCAGTLLNEYTVLTAFQCVNGYLPKDFTVVMGLENFDDYGDKKITDTRRIDEIIQYEEGSYYNDLAILTLKEPFEIGDDTKRALLADLQFEREAVAGNHECYAIGFGAYTDEYPWALSSYLRKLNIDISSRWRCRRYVRRTFPNVGRTRHIHAGRICSLDERGASCYGDAGAGVGCYDGETGRWTIVGIVSYGLRPYCTIAPDVFTRVSYYRDWIRRNMKRDN